MIRNLQITILGILASSVTAHKVEVVDKLATSQYLEVLNMCVGLICVFLYVLFDGGKLPNILVYYKHLGWII